MLTLRLLLIIFTGLISTGSFGSINQQLSQQLQQLAKQSTDIHNQLKKSEDTANNLAITQLADQVQTLHQQTLQEIIITYGWPNKELVGEKGVSAAFTLVKYSRKLTFQQSMLPHLIQSFMVGDNITGQELAVFIDTLAIAQGKKQTFGTQFERIGKNIQLLPIDNENSVDKLRAELGLSPLAKFKEELGISTQ